MPESTALRLGARGSLLSRMQSQIVADELERAHPGLKIDLCIVRTSGDVITDRPLHEFGGKGLFTKELEQAILDSQVDFAVHSFKDVPVTMPLVAQERLVVTAVPPREDPRDALACAKARRLGDLPPGAVVGTGSLRRRAQVLALRPDLRVEPIRGNVDTRLKKLRAGEFDAVLLAMAGLRRSGLYDKAEVMPIEADELLPAAGQGALSLQCRKDDARTRQLLAVLHDPATAACVEAERQIVARLNGDCHSPIAALATIEAGTMRLRAAVGGRDGRPPLVRAAAEGPAGQADLVINEVARTLVELGAERLLAG